MKKIVFAISDEIGCFKYLKLINKANIINDQDENEDGVFILEYKEEEEETLIEFFIDSIEI